MIWIAFTLLAALALAPLAFTLRGRLAARGRRESALALHRAQLGELDIDLSEGRIGVPEHQAAVLEIERRLLAAAAQTDAASAPQASRAPIVAALIMVPVAAFALYIVGGSPDLPAAPLAARIAAQKQHMAEEASLIAQLRTRLSTLDPHSDQARAGYVLLGNAEASRGRLPQAVEAWQVALAARFDATLAAETAEAMCEASGKIPPAAVALFQQALAAAPADAPWRPLAEQRLSQAKSPD